MNTHVRFWDLFYLMILYNTWMNWSGWSVWSWICLAFLILTFPTRQYKQVAQWIEVQLHKDPEVEKVIDDVEQTIKENERKR